MRRDRSLGEVLGGIREVPRVVGLCGAVIHETGYSGKWL